MYQCNIAHLAPGHGHFVSIMEIILIRMGEGGAGVNVFWVDRPYSTYLDILCDDRFGSAVLEAVGRGRRTGLWIASLGDGE